jgi:hypothetical protein
MTFQGPKLYLDIETRSRCDLKAAGARRYAADPSTQITTASWRWAGDPRSFDACNVPGLEHLGNSSMSAFKEAIQQANHIVAHHINFDASVIFATLGPCGMTLEKLDCTMARAQRMSLPGGLDALCESQGLQGKSLDGHRLVMATCKPRKDGTFNEDPAIFRQLLAYNVQDVRCLEAVDKILPPLPPDELEIWRRTWRKNALGLPVDIELCQRIAAKRHEIELQLSRDLRSLTGGAVATVSQNKRIMEWMHKQGVKIPNLQKATVESWLDMEDMPLDAYQVLTHLFESGGSAPIKAQALLDRQVHGIYQDGTRYFGARSGRGTSEGCFGRGTLVLTAEGWKRIVDVARGDRVWDGSAWVSHGGLLCQGYQKTIQIHGLTVTGSHLVLSGKTWVSAQQLKHAPWWRIRALATGSASLLSLVLYERAKFTSLSSVTAARRSALSVGKKLLRGALKAALTAIDNGTQRFFGTGGAMKTLRSAGLLYGCSQSSLAFTTVAPTQTTKTGITTEAGASASRLSGSTALYGGRSRPEKFLTPPGAALFWSTFSSWRTTASRVISLTESITMQATNRVIFVLSTAAKMQKIGAQQELLKKIGCFSEVYDLSNCGPKNRFMILSSAGPLLVHNCNFFNIARPSGKHDTEAVIRRLKAEPDGAFDNTELSDVLRGAVVAPEGYKLLDVDLSNIELRLSLWFAGDREKLDLLGSGKDLYATTAGLAMGIPELTKKTHPKERQAYKKVVLSGGYAIGPVRLFTAFKTDKDLPYEYRKDLTYAQVAAIHAGYRDTNWRLQACWKELDQAARAALFNRGAVVPACGGKLLFTWRKDVNILELRLPSGRTIPHYQPRISDEGEFVFYRAKFGRMLESRAFGGSWLEIACQSAARDVLTGVERQVEAELPDVRLLLDIYDSVVALAPTPVAEQRMHQIINIMRRVPAWAEGLPLDAEGMFGDRMSK